MAYDRRTFRRVGVRLDATVYGPGYKVKAQVVNLSRGGAYVKLPNSAQWEDGVNIKFKIPTSPKALELKGTVARVNTEEAGVGVGVSFADLPVETNTALSNYVTLQEMREELTTGGNGGNGKQKHEK